MNKLFKLIYVNILKLFGFNEIVTLEKKNIRSNSEIKMIILVIMALISGYLLYQLYFIFNIKNVLLIGFVLSVVMSFLLNFSNINSILFYDNDTEYLFSLPISTKQIVLSKLFNIYLKNIIYVIVIMLTSFLYYNNLNQVSGTLGIMLIICTLMIPLVPISLITLFLYFYNYMKIKRRFLLNIIWILLVIGISVISFFVKSNSLIEIGYYGYPLVALFDLIISCDMLAFILFIAISILVLYLYTLVLTDKYQVMVSTFKGVDKKNKKYNIKSLNCKKIGGTIKKELYYLFNNHKYFINIFGISIIFSLLFILLVIFKVRITNYEEIINLFGPTLLSMIAALGVFTINGISLEQNNLEMIKAMPIGFGKYLFAKVVSNLLVAGLFILINGICYSIIFERHGFNMVIGFILPLGAVLFNTVFCLLIDLLFPVKKASDESEILSKRLVLLVPKAIAIIIGLLPILLPM